MQALSENGKRHASCSFLQVLVWVECSSLFQRDLAFMEGDSKRSSQSALTNTQLNNCSDFALFFMRDTCLPIHDIFICDSGLQPSSCHNSNQPRHWGSTIDPTSSQNLSPIPTSLLSTPCLHKCSSSTVQWTQIFILKTAEKVTVKPSTSFSTVSRNPRNREILAQFHKTWAGLGHQRPLSFSSSTNIFHWWKVLWPHR